MATDLTLPMPGGPTRAPKTADDSLGIDRAFVLSMARVPVLAAAWVAVAWLADQAFRNLKERPKVKDLLRHKVGEVHHAEARRRSRSCLHNHRPKMQASTAARENQVRA